MRFRRLRGAAAALVLAALLPLAAFGQTVTGYKVNGVDLGSIFAPYHAGWPQAGATGYKVNGVDLDQLFAPLSTGSAASPTGFKVAGGADLDSIFAAYGTTGVQVLTQPSAVSGSAAAGDPSGPVTSNTTTVAGAKGGGSYGYTWHLSGAASLTAPNSATTGVTDGAVGAGATLTGTMYCTISDGVTSANTNSVGWSLTNTTPPYIFSGTVTAGEVSSGSGSTELRQFGWSVAVFDGGTVMGSISPSSDVNGHAIGAVYGSESGYPVPSSYGTALYIAGTLPQNYFTTMTVDSKSFSSASAAYGQSNGYTYWNWTGSTNSYGAILTSGGSNSVTIQ